MALGILVGLSVFLVLLPRVEYQRPNAVIISTVPSSAPADNEPTELAATHPSGSDCLSQSSVTELHPYKRCSLSLSLLPRHVVVAMTAIASPRRRN